MSVNRVPPSLSRAAVAVLLVAALLPGWVPAQEPPGAGEVEIAGALPEAGRLEGRVFGSDGKTPIAGAVVYAYHLDTDEVFASTDTDGKGRYVIEGLPLGWFDLFIRTEQGVFVANHVVSIAPKSKISASFTLTDYGAESTWFSGTARRNVPGLEEEATGVATLDRTAKEKSFWAKPAGVGILIGGGVLLLAGIILAGDDTTEITASPSTPPAK
jgi:hypothetical protein